MNKLNYLYFIACIDTIKIIFDIKYSNTYFCEISIDNVKRNSITITVMDFLEAIVSLKYIIV